MKILFGISSLNSFSHGNGGHYQSLKVIVSAIKSYHDVFVIDIGLNKSKALLDAEFSVYSTRSTNFFSLIHESIDYVNSVKPDVIHAFDETSFLFLRISARLNKIPFILTKCGGPNPKFYYPYSYYFINFSKENFDFFEKKRTKASDNHFLIPNRIQDYCYDLDLIEKINREYSLREYDCKLVRIGRIGKAYEKSILQTINLEKMLANVGIKTCSLIIGTIENEEIYNNIIKIRTDSSFFLIENKYTNNAKKLIGIADIVVGTGRGAMEALIKGVNVVVPCSNCKVPVLMTEENFTHFFDYNFSPRCTSEISEEESLNEIVRMHKENQLRCNTRGSSSIASKYLLIDSAIPTYLSIYSGIKYIEKLLDYDMILHLFTEMFRFYKKKVRRIIK